LNLHCATKYVYIMIVMKISIIMHSILFKTIVTLKNLNLILYKCLIFRYKE
jgi:hypothetical protein